MKVRKKRPRGFKKEAQGVQVSPLNPLSVSPCHMQLFCHVTPCHWLSTHGLASMLTTFPCACMASESWLTCVQQFARGARASACRYTRRRLRLQRSRGPAGRHTAGRALHGWTHEVEQAGSILRRRFPPRLEVQIDAIEAVHLQTPHSRSNQRRVVRQACPPSGRAPRQGSGAAAQQASGQGQRQGRQAGGAGLG